MTPGGGGRARLARPRRRVNEDDRILPLINVVFLLLVFFMVTGRLAVSDPFPIDPPESASEGAPAEGLLISLGPAGELALDGAIMPEAKFVAALGARLAREPEAEIRVKADGGAEAILLVDLLARLRQAGAGSVTLMTIPEQP